MLNLRSIFSDRLMGPSRSSIESRMFAN